MRFTRPKTKEVSTHSRPKAAGENIVKTLRIVPVSTHSRPKAAGSEWALAVEAPQFQHTAARRRLGARLSVRGYSIGVSTHSRPKAAGLKTVCKQTLINVSTHSRPKAAGYTGQKKYAITASFNTQPPEGGWLWLGTSGLSFRVSTHSRPKAAGFCHNTGIHRPWHVSTHSRPKAAGGYRTPRRNARIVSTHSRPKAAGMCCDNGKVQPYCFNTQPPEGGWGWQR